jgi:hypothetical protein
MPNKDIAALANDPALGALCASLGKIPVEVQSDPNSIIPIDWDTSQEVDWVQLVYKAQDESLAPLMYWILSRSGNLSSIPKSARTILRASYYKTWAINQNIYKELEILARGFEEAAIPLVVLKGACYARTIYTDIGLRPMTDLDLLVPETALKQAAHIAESIGYEEIEPVGKPVRLMEMSHHICMHKTSPPQIKLELHKELVAANSFLYAVPMGWFWEQTEPMVALSPKGQIDNLLMLTPPAQILYAAAHAMLEHGGMETHLLWLYDLDRLVRCYGGRLDWGKLLSQAKIFAWGSTLDAAFSKTVACFNTPIPEHVLSHLSGISDRNKRFVIRKQVRPTTDMAEQAQKLLSLKASARFRYLLGIVFPTTTYIRWRFQPKTPWAIPAFYLVHWWHILRSGLHLLIAHLKKGSPHDRI